MLVVRLRGALAALVVALVSFPAAAQFRLEPAFADQQSFGPGTAKGAVIWSHGRSTTSEDSLSPTPYYMSGLHDAGWDTFRLNRMRETDTLQESTRQLVRTVQDLRRRGYGKVVLAGQSFGAFISLMAADASDDVHAVVATAPAAFGSFSDFYDSWRANASRLYPLLETVRHARVMLFYFHGDDFDPGGRGDRSRAILSSHRIENLVIDQPPFLTGHWAASTGLFVRRFGTCIRNFIEAPTVPPEADCETHWGQSPSAQIPLPAALANVPGTQGAASADTGAVSVPENSFLGKWYGFYSNGREVLLAVERIRGDEVTAVYAVGPGIEPGEKAEWVRRTGRLVDDELVFKEKGRHTLRYHLRSDGHMAALWIASDGRTELDAVLRHTE